MTKPLKIQKEYDPMKGERTLLINGHGTVGEYFGECFVKGYTHNNAITYRGEIALPISEDVLMFNKMKGYDTMCLYYMDVEIYCSVDEFMAYGNWTHCRNGDWVIWCPINMLDVYKRERR